MSNTAPLHEKIRDVINQLDAVSTAAGQLEKVLSANGLLDEFLATKKAPAGAGARRG
jgi:hypothetical protein